MKPTTSDAKEWTVLLTLEDWDYSDVHYELIIYGPDKEERVIRSNPNLQRALSLTIRHGILEAVKRFAAKHGDNLNRS